MIKPIDIACNHVCYPSAHEQVNCEAQAGEPCNWSNCRHEHADGFHAERQMDAAACNPETAETPTVEEIKNAAIERLF